MSAGHRMCPVIMFDLMLLPPGQTPRAQSENPTLRTPPVLVKLCPTAFLFSMDCACFSLFLLVFINILILFRQKINFDQKVQKFNESGNF